MECFCAHSTAMPCATAPDVNPLSLVAGRVVVECASEVRLRCVRLRLVGQAKVGWEEQPPKWSFSQFQPFIRLSHFMSIL